MNFLIKVPINKTFDGMIISHNPEHVEIKESPHLCLNIFDSIMDESFIDKSSDQCRYFFIGDPIFDEKPKDFVSNFSVEKLRYLKGFFYLIKIDHKERILQVFNSIFSILPIYYYQTSQYYLISSRIDLINKNINDRFTVNKKFILEKILFNYPLFNDTVFNEIKTVPSNCFLSIDRGIQLKKHTEILDFFIGNPRPWKKSVNELSDFFIETTAPYFPEEKFFNSFTGGFDGRTLVAVAKKHSKEFSAYSYGIEGCSDIVLPAQVSQKIKLDYLPVYLNDNYVRNLSFFSGIEAIEKSEGNMVFSRAHYVHVAKKLSERTRFIITGNFGSELFRTFHHIPITGLIISNNLIEIFKHLHESDWINHLKNSDRLKYLNMHNFRQIFDEMLQDIVSFIQDSIDLPVNWSFSRFLYEELFRKYFGPEIIMQSYFLCNRTPFLDFTFISKLLTTELSGVYDDFFEENPVKRFKGQVLYSHIIKKSCPSLLYFTTDKGYSPIDLINPFGKWNILKSFVLRKLMERRASPQDLQKVRASFLYNSESWKSIKVNTEIFNENYLENKFQQRENIADLNILSLVLSENYFLKHLTGS